MKSVLILLLALHLSEGFLWKLLKNDGWPAASVGFNAGENNDESTRSAWSAASLRSNTAENNDEGPRKITYQAALSSEGSSKKEPKDPPPEADLEDDAIVNENALDEPNDKEAPNKTKDVEGVRKMSRGSFQGSVSAGSSGSQVLTQLVSQFIPTDFITRIVMDQLIPRNVQDLLGNVAGTFGLRAGGIPSLGQIAKGIFDFPGKMLSSLIVAPGQQIHASKRNLSPIEQIIDVVFGVVQGISDFISSVVNFISSMIGIPKSYNRAIKGVSDQMLTLTRDLLTRVTRDFLTAGLKPFFGLGIKKKGKKKNRRAYTPSYYRDEQYS